MYDELGDPHLKDTIYALKLVSLKSLFGKLFSINSFLDLILNFVQSLDTTDENISNIMQAPLWKSKISTLDKEKTLFLPLLVYFDD